MGFLSWIVLGLIAGWLAGMLFRGRGFGILGDIVVGIVGALIGGFLGSALLGWDVTGFNVSSIVLATLGAIVLLAVLKAFTPRRTTV